MSKRKEKRALKAEYEKTLAELADVRSLIDATYCRFNAVNDSAMLEACIYELSALQSKYNCAVRAVKSFYQ